MTHFARVGAVAHGSLRRQSRPIKYRLTRASRDWRLRGPRPRWSRGPRASYSAASGRLKDLTRLFCLIERHRRGVRRSLEDPTPPGSNEAPSCPSGPTQNEGRMHTHTHLLDGVHGAGCAGRLGYPTVLKNNFAGTQAAEMGEDPPLTHFCRYRGTCDVTSAVRRSVRGGARLRAI